MAGVPAVFVAMVDNVLPQLEGGKTMLSRTIACPYGEGDIGSPLSAVQKAHPDTVIGSYPKFDGQVYSTDIVIRSRQEADLGAAAAAVEAMLAEVAALKTKGTSASGSD
jgi:molybdopterin-biosynthesis enzyme MoeA-like protein